MEKLTITNYDAMTQDGIVVVDFFAERCGPCKVIAPALSEMATQLKAKVSFYKVDVDEEEELAGLEGIRAMPTMKVYSDGKLVETIVGANLSKLTEVLDRVLPKSE